MKNRKKIERYIRKRVPHWLVELDLVTWEHSIKFKRIKGDVDGDPVYAKVSVTWEYKSMSITINTPAMAEEGTTRAFIDKTLAHEMYHAKVARGWDVVKDLTELLGKWIVKLEEREVSELELMPLTRRAFNEGLSL
jgi:hypothetical protein